VSKGTNPRPLEAMGIRLKEKYLEFSRSDFIRKVVETYIVRMVIIGLGVIVSVVVARVLGPQGRGLYAVAFSLGNIGIQFGNFGLHSSNVYYVSRDRKLLPGLAANSLVVALAVGLGGSLAAWGLFQLYPSLAPVNGGLLILSLLWVPLGLSYLLVQNLLIGIQDMRSYNKVELGGKVLNLVIVGAMIAAGFVSVESFFGAAVAALGMTAVWVFFPLTRKFTSTFRPSWDLFKGGLRFGLKAYLAGFFSFMVLRIDLLMIKHMLDAEQTGYYSVAVNIADLVGVLPGIIGTVLYPKLSATLSEAKKWEYMKRVLFHVGILMLGLTLFLVVAASPLIGLLFGKAYLPAVPAFLWLLPGVFMIALNSLLMNYFASQGMPWVTVYSPGIAALLNIVSNLFLIPRYGIVGASLSSVLAYGCMLVFSVAAIFNARRKRRG